MENVKTVRQIYVTYCSICVVVFLAVHFCRCIQYLYVVDTNYHIQNHFAGLPWIARGITTFFSEISERI